MLAPVFVPMAVLTMAPGVVTTRSTKTVARTAHKAGGDGATNARVCGLLVVVRDDKAAVQNLALIRVPIAESISFCTMCTLQIRKADGDGAVSAKDCGSTMRMGIAAVVPRVQRPNFRVIRARTAAHMLCTLVDEIFFNIYTNVGSEVSNFKRSGQLVTKWHHR